MTAVRGDTGGRRRAGPALGAVALVLLVGVACAGDDGGAGADTTTSTTAATSTTDAAPERAASTTTTAYDASTVEGEVEAAYLRSWDVYADAVYDLVLDEEALAEVYAGAGLANVRADIESRIADSRAAHVTVGHDYVISLVDGTTASVLDEIVNHQVLIDPVTKKPIEEDPSERQVLNFVMRRLGEGWFVELVQRVG